MPSTIGPARESWLEIIDGSAPILLIAPHGGRAGAAAHATLHPKVNDLETAAIARELAHRLDARALINSGMDRNELDCNRLAQLAARAPWMLELIADQVERIASGHGRAIVLLIHGWNVIEPRVDLGLGLREHDGHLRPPAGAQVSASDEFINGAVRTLMERLGAAGIAATFGMRYPGGARQNLLQAFTARHRLSDSPAIRRLAELSADRGVDALQLELSVAVRLPGPLRTCGLAAITEAFRAASPDGRAGLPERTAPSNGAGAARVVIRETAPRPAAAARTGAATGAEPTRFGVEFFDQSAGLGGIASFDLGAGGGGARIMILFDGCHAALFTADGRPACDVNSITLGPLRLAFGAGGGTLRFQGPAIVVSDGAAYLNVENAIAGGSLDPGMSLDATLELDGGTCVPRTGIAAAACFGRLAGEIVIAGRRWTLDAVARVGVSLTALGAIRFASRRTLWARFERPRTWAALEAREILTTTHDTSRDARILPCGGGWRTAAPGPIELTAAPPPRITAVINAAPDIAFTLAGRGENFMTLSRPGPDGVRIHTTIGFATFRLDGASGAGMYEYSRIAGGPAPDARLSRNG